MDGCVRPLRSRARRVDSLLEVESGGSGKRYGRDRRGLDTLAKQSNDALLDRERLSGSRPGD
jgi:hypothetical protein